MLAHPFLVNMFVESLQLSSWREERGEVGVEGGSFASKDATLGKLYLVGGT